MNENFLNTDSILSRGLTKKLENLYSISKIGDLHKYKPEIKGDMLFLAPYRVNGNVNQLLLDALHNYDVKEVFFYNGMMSFESFLENADINSDKIHDIKYLDFHDLLVISKGEYLEYYDEVPKNLNWLTGEIHINDLQLLYRCINCNIKTNYLRFDNFVGIGSLKRFLDNYNTLKTNILHFSDLDGIQQRQDFYNFDKMFPSWMGFYHKFLIENLEVQKILYHFDLPYNDALIWTLEPEKDLLNEEDIKIEKERYPTMDDKMRLDLMKRTYKEEIICNKKYYFGIVKNCDLIYNYAVKSHEGAIDFLNNYLNRNLDV